MFKLFIDSIVFRIDYKMEEDKELIFNNIINFLERLPDIYLQQNEKLPAKFYRMHLTKNILNQQLIECFSFTSKPTQNYQKIYIYSTHHGINIALHGLVQYDEDDNRAEKLNLLYLLYKKYKLKFIKIDIALDINEKVDNISVYDKENLALKYQSKSKAKALFFQETTQDRSKQQRALKLYEKHNQKHRSFPYAKVLSRLEMTLRSGKLARFEKTYLQDRIMKELSYYRIYIKDELLTISKENIDLLLNDLFNILENGKNNKSYASYYRNITISASNMKLAWTCHKENIPKKLFVKSHDIGLTVLKKYCKFYEEGTK
jgi:hypothetical protein